MIPHAFKDKNIKWKTLPLRSKHRTHNMVRKQTQRKMYKVLLLVAFAYNYGRICCFFFCVFPLNRFKIESFLITRWGFNGFAWRKKRYARQVLCLCKELLFMWKGVISSGWAIDWLGEMNLRHYINELFNVVKVI